MSTLPSRNHASYWSFLWQPTLLYGINSLIVSYLIVFYYHLRPSTIAFCFAVGILIWTMLEYVTHRYFLHWPASVPQWYPFAKYLHIGHHENSKDPFVFIIPVPFTLAVYLLIYGILHLITQRLDHTLAIMLGIMVSYLAFEWFHSVVHLSESPAPWLVWYRKYHYVHHFKDDSRHFGVTSPLWDFLFRTL